MTRSAYYMQEKDGHMQVFALVVFILFLGLFVMMSLPMWTEELLAEDDTFEN